jgi:hypothetical protein
MDCKRAENMGRPYEPKQRSVSENTLTYEQRMERDMDQYVIEEMRKYNSS